MNELLAFARPFGTPSTLAGLSDRQILLSAQIRDYWTEHGFAPSFRDLAIVSFLDDGRYLWRENPSVVRHNLRRLRELGLVDFDDKINRSIRHRRLA